MKISFSSLPILRFFLLFGFFILIIGIISIKKIILLHPTTTSVIEIEVKEGEGWPIKGAEISLVSKHSFSKSTNMFGSAEFKIPSAKYELKVRKQGYKPFEDSLDLSIPSISGRSIILTELSDEEPSRILSLWQQLPDGWIFYQNLVVGFSIKYPSKWSKSEHLFSTMSGTNLNLVNEKGVYEVAIAIDRKIYYSEKTGRNLTINEVLPAIKEALESEFPNFKMENIFINEMPATKFYYEREEEGIEEFGIKPSKAIYYRIYLQKEGETDIFQIEAIIFDTKRLKDYSPIVDEIISTFQFIKS